LGKPKGKGGKQENTRGGLDITKRGSKEGQIPREGCRIKGSAALMNKRNNERMYK